MEGKRVKMRKGMKKFLDSVPSITLTFLGLVFPLVRRDFSLLLRPLLSLLPLPSVAFFASSESTRRSTSRKSSRKEKKETPETPKKQIPLSFFSFAAEHSSANAGNALDELAAAAATSAAATGGGGRPQEREEDGGGGGGGEEGGGDVGIDASTDGHADKKDI
jgi:hypothetical protein